MKITILGSGTLFPTKKRKSSSILLETEKAKILIDCGHCTLASLVDLNIDPREIDLIFISHFHTDHFGDAFNLVHSRFVGDLYEKNKKHKPLIILGPQTIKKRFEKWREIYWPEPKENYPIKFIEGEFKFNFQKINFESFLIKHVPWFQSIGVRIKTKRKLIVYPGDFGTNNNLDYLVKKFYQADLLFLEAGYKELTPNHFCLDQVNKLVSRAKVKKVYIIHIRPLKEEEQRIKKIVQDSKNKIFMAEDKKIIKI